jgi:hypothetical protein
MKSLRCHWLLPLIPCAILVVGCHGDQLSDSNSSPAPRLVGGWEAAELSPKAKAAATFAVQKIAKVNPERKLRAVHSVQQQVVAGMNYRFTLEMTDQTRWEAVVYENLEGAFSLTGLKELD